MNYYYICDRTRSTVFKYAEKNLVNSRTNL